MTFEFFRFRFHFRSGAELYFPPYKAGNIVRGAFGSIFRKLVCVPECQDARTCPVRATCHYARIFEPRAARGQGPSGLADWPRPFVFRASSLDGRTIRAGEQFHFDVHLFDVREPALPYFEKAFAELAREGIGPRRSPAALMNVEALDLGGLALATAHPNVVDLSGLPETVHRVLVRFVTPTDLKGGNELVCEPRFGVLFGRLRDRISALRAIYGPGHLDVDFKAMGERAARVRTVRSDLRYERIERTSARTGQRHPLGGFLGEAEYQGDVAEFLPYLRLGRWVGVGRQTVWGKGEIRV